MIRALACSFIYVALSLSLASPGWAQEARPLFNGRDLSGWVLVNTPPQTWKVVDGMLVCSGKPIGELRTERMYQNFELEVEWRHMVPGGNAGIFVWADDITAPGVPFHRGIEVQVLEHAYGNTQSYTTHGDIFPIHGARMVPENGRGGSRAFPTEERSKPSPQWNHYKIVCQDGQISLAVNGKVVTRGRESTPRKGYICLESEGGVVHYRNLLLKELPDTPIDDPAHVAIANRGYRSIYTGLDLSGWTVPPAGESAWHPDDWTLRFDGSVTANQARFEHTLDQPCQGMVIDFLFSDKSHSLTIQLANDESLVLTPDGQSKYAQVLKPAGQWNRAELKLDSQQLILNEQPFPVTLSAKSNRLAILPDGAVDLANLYVR